MTTLKLEWFRASFGVVRDLAWPAVAIFLALFFKTQITDIVERLVEVSFGSARAKMRQKQSERQSELRPSQQRSADGVELAASISATSSADGSLAAGPPQEGDPAQPASDDLLRQLISQRRAAVLWEFRWLDHYLVPFTQLLLENVSTRQGMTLHEIDTEFQQRSIDERQAMLNALVNTSLVNRENNFVTTTPKGQAYLRYRGPFKDYMQRMGYRVGGSRSDADAGGPDTPAPES